MNLPANLNLKSNVHEVKLEFYRQILFKSQIFLFNDSFQIVILSNIFEFFFLKNFQRVAIVNKTFGIISGIFFVICNLQSNIKNSTNQGKLETRRTKRIQFRNSWGISDGRVCMKSKFKKELHEEFQKNL